MRWLNYAGLNARGFFNLFTKAPLLAGVGGLAQGNGGFMADGFFLTSGEVKTASRFNVSFDALAQHTHDILIPAPFAAGCANAFHVTGRFIIQDNNLNVADATDGDTWHIGSNPGGQFFPHYGLVFDDVHNAIIACTPFNPDVMISTNASPLNFVVNAGVFAGGDGVNCLGYKGAGTGIVLGVVQQGGTNGFVYKSTDGGTTWAHVGTVGGITNAGNFIGFFSGRWLTIGTNGTTFQSSFSTDDGATWSAPFTFPGGVLAGGGIATDGAGNWCAIGASSATPNYFVSNDNGSTWTAPNTFTGNGGSFPGLLLWDGTQFCAFWNDSTFAFNFAARSPDGATWTKHDNVIVSP